MRKLTAALLTPLAALALSACSTTDEPADPKPSKSAGSEPSKEDRAKAREAAGLPADPTGKARAGYIAALWDIDPWFINDKGEEDAIDNGVNQCSSLDSDKAIQLAQQRFGKGPAREVTKDEAEKLNAAVRKYICPDKD